MTRKNGFKLGLASLFSVAATILTLTAIAFAEHHEAGEPVLSLEKSRYAPGENIVVKFSNGPGNKNDWIAVYEEDVAPGTGIFTELWYFANGKREAGETGASDGTVVLDSASDNPENTEVDWPLAEGVYDVYFLCCDDYGVLAGPVKLEIASDADIAVDVDGVWAISEKGTAAEGANCDRWASGQGSSPGAISDTDPGIQNEATGDANHIRYGAADVNAEPPPCMNFADQSGFSFWGETGVSLPVDGSPFSLGEFTHYNTSTNVDLADYNPLQNVGLTITLSGDVDAAAQYTVTMVETMNDDVPCKFPDAPNTPPCGEKITIKDDGMQATNIAIAGKQYSMEMLGFNNCDPANAPSKILYTREMAIDIACVNARLVENESKQ